MISPGILPRALRSNNKMKVYFAGSIRGGRNDAALYAEMIRRIKEKHEVLTEHVGDLALSALEGSGGRDEAIYLKDTALIRECDMLIAECSNPSLGVGYELAFAEALGKPCFVFFNKARGRLSAMIAGDGYFTVLPYSDEQELFDKLESVI